MNGKPNKGGKGPNMCPCHNCVQGRAALERSQGLMLKLAVDLMHRPREVFSAPGQASAVEISISEIMIHHSSARRMSPRLFGRAS